jgi:hypothetical protein
MQHLEALNRRLSVHGPVIAHVAIGTALEDRVVDWENPAVDVTAPPDPNWTR